MLDHESCADPGPSGPGGTAVSSNSRARPTRAHARLPTCGVNRTLTQAIITQILFVFAAFSACGKPAAPPSDVARKKTPRPQPKTRRRRPTTSYEGAFDLVKRTPVPVPTSDSRDAKLAAALLADAKARDCLDAEETIEPTPPPGGGSPVSR